MEPVHVVAVIDDRTGHEAIYVGGDLFDQGSTIYACDIAMAAKGKVIQFSQIRVEMPASQIWFPQQLEQCMLWKPVDTVST